MSEITAKNVLIEAINLLETKGWTQDEFARDENGKGVASLSKSATCFCTIGAIHAAEHSLTNGRVVGLREDAKRAVREVLWGSVAMWNDTEGRTKEEVIEVLGRSVAIWNDTEGRTKEEVIEVLKQAAEIAEE